MSNITATSGLGCCGRREKITVKSLRESTDYISHEINRVLATLGELFSKYKHSTHEHVEVPVMNLKRLLHDTEENIANARGKIERYKQKTVCCGLTEERVTSTAFNMTEKGVLVVGAIFKCSICQLLIHL